ncbi:MAG: M3 family oligoendopeptidase [Candidatus Berkelbacteria bacterium]|nr:MAG: M3 family oligoendopeptidase [Candidatus Berkelbacteria bacterium]QQG51452.1 MAG: M3 family oligoendopeptidase [Candidatus Berkelbacteria bacterium]
MKSKRLNTHDWDLTALYKSDDDPQIERDLQEISRVVSSYANKWRKRDDYLRDPEALLDALEEGEQIAARLGMEGKPGYYFGLKSNLDLNDPTIKARNNKINEVGKNNSNAIRFFRLNLGKISEAQQEIFLNSPKLKKYHRFLARLFKQAEHFLTDPEERVFSLLHPSAYSRWTEMVSGFLAKEERVVLLEDGKRSKTNYSKLHHVIFSKNKKVRDDAAAAINDILFQHVEVAENELNAILETKKVSDELRGYTRPDAARHLADDIDSTVVDALVDAVSKRFKIAHRYYALKARLLGVSKLAYHERSIKYGDIDHNYSYDKALDVVRSALSKVDEEFVEIFEKFVENGQIDVFPKKGKRAGAFCTMYLVSLPTYILLNHTDSFRDVTTLAHEVGHGINDELIKKRQPATYAHTPLATAEVASTFMEDFTVDELLKDADDELRLAVMVMKLGDDISTIIRQVAAYKCEQELHKEYRQRGYLSKEEIGNIFQEHMRSYMGPTVEQSPGSENWWVGWHHFRRPFYVYSYASGLLISKALQRKFRQEPTFILKIKEFLSAGSSVSPKNIFLALGIDIEDKAFWDQGLDEVEQLLRETEKLAKKLKKI